MRKSNRAKQSAKTIFKRYVSPAIIGYVIGILNFLVLYELVTSCGNIGHAGANVEIFLLISDLLLLLAAQYFLFRGAGKLAFLLMLLFVILGIVPITAVTNSCPIHYCAIRRGFTCYGIALSSSGNLSIAFMLDNGTQLYNIGMGCAANGERGVILPNPPQAMVLLSGNGSATTVPANSPSAGALSMPAGQLVSVTGLKCWSAQAAPLNSSNISNKTTFIGTLWLNYTTEPGAPGVQNPMHTFDLADVGSAPS